MEEKIVQECVRISIAVNQTSMQGEECECDTNIGTCRYVAVASEEIQMTFPWVTFVILSEMFVKIIPAIILVILNAVVIDGLQKVLKRRNTLCIQDAQMKAYHVKSEILKSCPEYKESVYLHKIAKLRKVSKRDTNIMKLLLVMSLVFFCTNVPMAVGRIMSAVGFHHQLGFQQFVILSNVLEVFYAASNFYLYCFCNSQIRNKVLTK